MNDEARILAFSHFNSFTANSLTFHFHVPKNFLVGSTSWRIMTRGKQHGEVQPNQSALDFNPALGLRPPRT
jgi:hypothetical protein